MTKVYTEEDKDDVWDLVDTNPSLYKEFVEASGYEDEFFDYAYNYLVELRKEECSCEACKK